jgi:hypothetical protein
VVAGKISLRRVHEQRAETFLNRARLFAKQADHIQKIRVDNHSRKKSPKVFFTNAKATPRVTLIDETVSYQLWPASAKKRTDTTEVIEPSSMIAFKLSVVRICSVNTSCAPSVDPLIGLWWS